MRSAGAIFRKQVKDILRNPMVLVQFIIFPAVAWIMTEMVAKPSNDIPDNMFITMMAAIFAGMALIASTAAAIAEDKEHKSIRFLVMAGVKPGEYLLGTGGCILLAGAVVSVLFGLMGNFTTAELLMFLAVMIASTAASVILGATIGMLSKNQQAATAMAMPAAVILGFTPMIASFNENVKKAANVLYTGQLNAITENFTANFAGAMTVIGANIAVLLVLFVLAYSKKGLRG